MAQIAMFFFLYQQLNACAATTSDLLMALAPCKHLLVCRWSQMYKAHILIQNLQLALSLLGYNFYLEKAYEPPMMQIMPIRNHRKGKGLSPNLKQFAAAYPLDKPGQAEGKLYLISI